MAVNFPDSPTNGDTFTSNGITFVYNSTDDRWDAEVDIYDDTNVDTHLNTSTAATNEILSYNGVDYAWVALYTDTSVDTHLNTSTAANNEVLSYDGSDYAWVAQPSSGIALTDLSVTTNSAGSAALTYSNSTGVFTYTPPDLSSYATSAATVYSLTGTDIDPANGGIQTKTFSADTTFTESLTSGESVVLMLDAGASYTITWPTITWVTSNGNSAPTLTANDTVVLWKVSTTLYGAYVGSYT